MFKNKRKICSINRSIKTNTYHIVSMSNNQPTGRALASDWYADIFLKVIYEKIFLVVFWTGNSDWTLKFAYTTIAKLFSYQSEVSALPAGWQWSKLKNLNTQTELMSIFDRVRQRRGRVQQKRNQQRQMVVQVWQKRQLRSSPVSSRIVCIFLIE